MAQLSETTSSSQLAGALDHGISVLDLQQEITLKLYTRTILPLDGFVYWVPMGEEIVVRGSLHYAQEIQQNEDETQGLETITFTSKDKVVEFEAAPINTLYIGETDKFRFAFSAQQGFYTQAALWHYFGHSISPAMSSLLLDIPGSVHLDQATVSNSMPLWLQFNGYVSQFYDGFSVDGVPFFVAPPTLYPSQLTAPNLVPPYGSVHIGPNDTEALQSVPYIDRNRNHYQLCADRVQITLYGLQHNAAMDFIDAVMEYSRNTGNFGIMNMPVVRDGKRTQVELQAIAQQKLIELKISYNQQRVAEIRRQLILSAVPTYLIQDGAL